MKKLRREEYARVFALQTLYAFEIKNELEMSKVNHDIFDSIRNPKVKKLALTLVKGTIQYLNQFNEIINKFSKNWTLERMALIDRNIMRISIYEMLILKTKPPIIIDCAIEMAKAYSTNHSGAFVNGILDAINKNKDDIIKQYFPDLEE